MPSRSSLIHFDCPVNPLILTIPISLTILIPTVYSDLRLFTGFIIPALIAWKLTVITVIISAPTLEITRIQGEIFIRYTYPSSQALII